LAFAKRLGKESQGVTDSGLESLMKNETILLAEQKGYFHPLHGLSSGIALSTSTNI
jgi:hypothetical protein